MAVVARDLPTASPIGALCLIRNAAMGWLPCARPARPVNGAGALVNRMVRRALLGGCKP